MRAARPIRPFPLVILSLVVLLASCRGGLRYPRSLTLADSLTECCPDSALRYLDRLRPAMDGAGEADRMYYRLLCVKAADKAYIPHTSDSLIRPVLDYYEQGGDARLLPVARYYAGRVSMDLGDAPQAISYFQKALESMGEQSEFLRQKRFVYTQMGELFIRQSLFDEALIAYKNALNCNDELNDTTEVIFSLTDLASAYNFRNQRIEALKCLGKAFELSKVSKNDDALPNITNQLARTYLHLHQTDSARKYIQKAMSHTTAASHNATLTIAIDIYSQIGKQDSVQLLCKQLLQSDDIFNKRYAWKQLANNEAYFHHDQAAIHYYKLWSKWNDSVEAVRAQEQIAKINAVYNYQLREKENIRIQRENQERKFWLVLFFSLTLLLIVIMIYQILYNKKRHQTFTLKLEKYEKQIKEYQKTKEKKNLKKDFLNTELYWQLEDSIKHKKSIKEEQIKELTLYLNRVLPSFYDDLTKLTKISNNNYLICMLVILGFDTASIACLLSKTPQAINSSRQRLYEKAFGEKGSPKKWDDLLFSLSSC